MTFDPVAFAASRAAGRPAFLAFARADSAAAEGLDDAALAARLGCPPDVLAHVRLCRTPPADPDGFRAAVERISAKFGVHLRPLGDAVRLGQTVAALANQPDAAPTEAGHLLAARDRPPQ